MNKQIPREFWIVAVLYASMLFALSIVTVFGGLSPRVFAVLVVVSLIFPFLRYWKLFQNAATDTPRLDATQVLSTYRDQATVRIRSTKIRIVVLSAFACFAMWETRSAPLAPRIVGLGFLLILLMGNILVLRQARKMLGN